MPSAPAGPHPIQPLPRVLVDPELPQKDRTVLAAGRPKTPTDRLPEETFRVVAASVGVAAGAGLSWFSWFLLATAKKDHRAVRTSDLINLGERARDALLNGLGFLVAVGAAAVLALSVSHLVPAAGRVVSAVWKRVRVRSRQRAYDHTAARHSGRVVTTNNLSPDLKALLERAHRAIEDLLHPGSSLVRDPIADRLQLPLLLWEVAQDLRDTQELRTASVGEEDTDTQTLLTKVVAAVSTRVEELEAEAKKTKAWLVEHQRAESEMTAALQKEVRSLESGQNQDKAMDILARAATRNRLDKYGPESQ